jgi:hypothetical protein
MKTIILLSVSLFVLNSCQINRTVRQSYRYEMYIDYRYISYEGRNSRQTINFTIDSIRGIFFYGKLLINNRDTFALRGFEKGDLYYTSYTKPGEKNSRNLKIRSAGPAGQIRDSITLYDWDETDGIIKEATVLYRSARTSCP